MSVRHAASRRLWAVSLLTHCCALSLAARVHELPAGRPPSPACSRRRVGLQESEILLWPGLQRAGTDGTREAVAAHRDAHASALGALGWVGAPSAGSLKIRTASSTQRTPLRQVSSRSLLAGKQLLPAAALLRTGRNQPARLSMSGGGVVVDPPADFARAKRPELAPDVTLYAGALRDKVERVRELLKDFLPPSVDLEVFESPPVHYRMRAEFRIWHDGDSAKFAFFDPETKKPIFVEEYQLACTRINRMMRELIVQLDLHPKLKKRLFQVEMIATTEDAALLSMVYKAPVDQEWEEEAAGLAAVLDCQIIGRSRGKKTNVAGEGYLVQTHTVGGREYPQWQTENRFSQSNAHICAQMLTWAQRQLSPDGSRRTDDLLELYCGNGSFSLPLASVFNRVVATELDKYSVRAAKACATLAEVDNIKFAALSAAEISQAMRGDREFRRLQQESIELPGYDFQALLLDPPRAGLDPDSAALAAGFQEVLYVSCNPANLVRDLQALPEHEVVSAALFDQFPWTDHAEVAVRLRKTV